MSEAPEKGAALLAAVTNRLTLMMHSFSDAAKLQETQEVMDSAPEVQVAFVKACVDRVGTMRDRLGPPSQKMGTYMNLHHHNDFPSAGVIISCRLLRRKLPFAAEDLLFLVKRTADLEKAMLHSLDYLPAVMDLVEEFAKAEPLSSEMRHELGRLEKALDCCGVAAERKMRARIAHLIEEPVKRLPLQAGEAWSDQAIADVNAMPAEQRARWCALLEACTGASGATPSAKWMAAAKELLKAVGQERFKERVLPWFDLVSKPRTQVIANWSEWIPDPNRMIIDPHMDILKGLVWVASLMDDADISRGLAGLAVTSYKKVPKIGPRAVRVGNACVWALGEIPALHAVGQLAVLRVAVKFGTAQKGIEKAFNAAGKRMGMSRGDLEEMGVPAYGFDAQGKRVESFGEARAELRIVGREVNTTWFNAKGKAVKSPPAEVKKEFAEEFKELKSAAVDAEKMLSAQSDRLDNLMGSSKTWKLAEFRERYLEHPIVGAIARRLIWLVDGVAVIFIDGAAQDVAGKTVAIGETAEVAVWHPVLRAVEEVQAWRRRLADLQITQPFKQAHREIYVLTDAERNTRTYSNRFAAHVLKQHQFNALAAIRGWKNKLRLMVDDEFPPASKELPDFGLRAEFWIEGAGDEYGTDTNETGVFLRVATDQVRFYRIGTAQLTAHAPGGGYGPRYRNPIAPDPVPLEEVPALALSEVMRDVDLFVGVCSVGNDPTWNDGGPEGRLRQYWQDVSFGELTATAKTRREVLEHLVPRLAIRNVCRVEDRFLIVQGKLRTYKIHLGSGNILMEPNDQYLCIVPGRSEQAGGDGKMFLPFEGDRTLAVILSKAFLLAADDKIKDVTITRQLGRQGG